MAKRSGIDGLKELERVYEQLGKVPQTIVNKAARAGASISHKAARQGAPVDEGDLKRGIVMKKERRVKIAKAVYDIMMDPAKNDIFVKTTKEGTRYYYPASQEYGFLTVDGGYVPGYQFLRRSVTENVDQIEKRVLDVTGQAVDKALKMR